MALIYQPPPPLSIIHLLGMSVIYWGKVQNIRTPCQQPNKRNGEGSQKVSDVFIQIMKYIYQYSQQQRNMEREVEISRTSSSFGIKIDV